MEEFEQPHPEVLAVQLDTYERLDGRPDAVEWVEAAARLLGPARTDVALWVAGAAVPRLRKAGSNTWEEAGRRWAASELVAVSARQGSGNVAEVWSYGQIRDGRPNVLRFGVRLDTLQAGVDAVEPEVLRLLHDGAVRFGAVAGFAYVDARLHPTGVAVAIEEDPAVEVRLRDLVRGYYWATILSSGHLERLGGYPRVAAEAPCARVTDLAGETLVCLQLTESVAEVTDDQLRELRDFLDPVLPGGDPSRRGTDAPLRVFEDRPRPDPTGAPPPVVRTPSLPRPVSLPVETMPEFEWEAAAFKLVLAEPLDAVQEQGVRRVVEAWGTTAQFGGFGGTLHEMGAPHATVEDGAPVVLWSADLGSAERAAVDRLVQMLERACSLYGIRPAKLVLG